MKSRRQMIALAGGLIALCTAFCVLICSIIISRCEAAFYDRAAAVASVFPDQAPEVMKALKYPENMDIPAGRELLQVFGYRGRIMNRGDMAETAAVCALFLLCFSGVVFTGLSIWKRKEAFRIAGLTQYLREVEDGVYPALPGSAEDKFSHLEDEIYKTVAALRESREAALKGKENLAKNLADISHQLKTPLTGISLMGEVLLNSSLDGKQRQAAETIVRQNDRMAVLVKSLLTLSRLDAGVLPLKPQNTSANELISGALQAVEPLMRQKKQSLAIRGDREAALVCDVGWTAEALGNLLKNCSEYGPEGSVITVTAEQNPLYTQITVEDEGAGFSSGDLAHLFDRFYKGKQAAKDSIGIGLSLARAAVRRQGGDVTAENRKEGGARFVMRFYKGITGGKNF